MTEPARDLDVECRVCGHCVYRERLCAACWEAFAQDATVEEAMRHDRRD